MVCLHSLGAVHRCAVPSNTLLYCTGHIMEDKCGRREGGDTLPRGVLCG